MIRSKKHKRSVHDNADRWLLTYADLITLLLGLFVILYTMSKVDNTKYLSVVKALGGMFGQEGVLQGSNAPMQHQAVGSQEEIAGKIRAAMTEDLKTNMVDVSQDSRGVVVHLAEELLFPSGSATLKSSSLSRLDKLGEVLATLRNDIRVEGHTDNVPINTSTFPSNWQLSVARAMNTGDYLMSRHGLSPERVTIVGYSQYKPLAPNTSEENKAKNRRVDIVIVSEGQVVTAP
ncbi:MAG: OmpA family protein [Ignavibacteriae bacterium]|nr:OmpA family protein [Ignavibacteriota bacterium]